MTCEEYLIEELEKTKTELKECRKNRADLLDAAINMSHVFNALGNHLKLEERNGKRLLTMGTIFEDYDADAFAEIYEHLKYIIDPEDDNKNEAETCGKENKMTEIKFDCLNKNLAESQPHDYDASFISIACDTWNACSSVVKAMHENDIITVSECHDAQIKLLTAVISTFVDLVERFEKGEGPIDENGEP